MRGVSRRQSFPDRGGEALFLQSYRNSITGVRLYKYNTRSGANCHVPQKNGADRRLHGGYGRKLSICAETLAFFPILYYNIKWIFTGK